MGNVVINGKTAVHAESGGMLQTQDVCEGGGKCRTKNLTNIAQSKDADKTASTVFINGNPVCHVKSTFAKSTGDEPGNCGGKKSGTIKQMAEFLAGSPNVMIEGQPAVRQGDMMVSNMRNTPPAALKQPGAGIPPGLSLEEPDGVDKAIGPDDQAWELGGGEMYLLKGRLRIEGKTDEEEDPEHKRWELPLDVTDEVEAHRRVVRFKNLPNEPLSAALVVNDNQQGEYAIPLGRDLPTVKADIQKPQWENILLPVVPVRYTTADPGEKSNREAAQALRPDGYVYIFLDGCLWRELKVTKNSNFCDVNLSAFQGEDVRPAHGEFDTRIVLPLQINGKKPKLEMAYSEVQWSWARIDALGGMAKDDPRRWVPVSKTKDDALRAKRMQVIDLIPYPNTGWVMSGPVGRVADSPKIHHLKLHTESKIPTVYLHDAMGIADRLARELDGKWDELQALVASLETGIKPTKMKASEKEELSADEKKLREALLAQHRSASILYQVGFGTKEGGERFGKHMNKALLRTLLAVQERAELRKDITQATSALLVQVKSDAYQTALEDYLNNTAERVLEGKRALVYHSRWLSRAPHALDAYLDIPEDRKDAGRVAGADDYLQALLEGKTTGGKLLDAVVEVNGKPDNWSKWGEASYTLVDMFSDMPKFDTQFLPLMAAKLNAVQGRGIPIIEVEKVRYTVTPPKGYRPVPGAMREEIVEYVGNQEVRTVTDSAAAKRVLAQTDIPSASGLSTMGATARNIVILPNQAQTIAEQTVHQLVAKEKRAAQAASAAVRARWFNTGFMGVLVALDAFNVVAAWQEMTDGHVSLEKRINVVGAITGAGDTASNLMKFRAKAIGNVTAAGRWELAGRVLGGVAWVATGVLSWMQAYRKFAENDHDAGGAYIGAAVAAMGAGLAPFLPAFGVAGTTATLTGVGAIVLCIALLIAAVYLEDDPLEQFVKNGPLCAKAALPQGSDLWARLRVAADKPYVSEPFRETWPEWNAMGQFLWDYLFSFEIKVFMEQQRSEESSLFAHIFTAKTVKIVLPVRTFQRGRSQFELPPLRVYPSGLGGHYEAVEPSRIDFSQDGQAASVKLLHLTYDLSRVKSRLRSGAECLFFTRLDLEPEHHRFIPQATGAPRYLAAREPLTNVVYPFAGEASLGQWALYGKNRRAGTLTELENAKMWKD